MRIAINSYISNRGISGSAIAVEKIHESLVRLGHEVIIIKPSSNFKSKIMNLVYLVLWDTWICSRRAIQSEAEILINTCNTGLHAPQIRSVLVIHDTMVLDNKDDFDAGYRIYAKIMFWLSAKKARVIMTPSEFSKKSIENHWPKRNVIVNYWPIKQSSVNQNRLVNGNFIILWNAAMEKHKQPQLMLDIAIEVRKKLGIKLQLYVVTRRGNAWSNFMEELEKIPKWSEWITIYSNLSTEELSSLYELSDVLLVTSKAEGFCLPALEAMAKSLPVVHNNIETLVEVCGYRLDDHDFGILDSMVQQCVALSRNSEKLEDVRMQARHRSLNFSEERFDRQMQWILEES